MHVLSAVSLEIQRIRTLVHALFRTTYMQAGAKIYAAAAAAAASERERMAGRSRELPN
jgi:hypothetical protein